jgi:hypothetical protein
MPPERANPLLTRFGEYILREQVYGPDPIRWTGWLS